MSSPLPWVGKRLDVGRGGFVLFGLCCCFASLICCTILKSYVCLRRSWRNCAETLLSIKGAEAPDPSPLGGDQRDKRWN